MKKGTFAHVIMALGCLSLMCLVFGVHAVGAQNEDNDIAQVRKGTERRIRERPLSDILNTIEPIRGIVPKIRGFPPGPDLMLEPCEVLCDRGGGYSREVCEQYGYSNQFTYEVRARLRNVGYRPANFAEGWRMWQVLGLGGLEVALPIGSLQSQEAPSGGFSLAGRAEMPESRSPALSDLVLSPGKHTVRFTADPDDHIKETVEDNNTIECSWNVVATAPGAPFDLAITGLSVFPSSGSPWADFTVVVTVQNLGEALFDTIETSCTPGGSFYAAKIDADEKITTTYSIPVTLSPGVHKIICTVRAPGYSEHDTSNNTLTATFTVTPI